MPLIKPKGKPAPEPEAPVEGVSQEAFDALQTQVTELSEKLDALITEINSAAPADPETPADPEDAGDAPADAPADDGSGEVQIPTVEEIKAADDAQLKEWRGTLFDPSDAKKPLAEIKKELLEVAKAAEAGNDDPAPSEDETPADDADAGDDTPPAEDDDPPPAKGKGTNGNVFGLVQDKKTKMVANEKQKPISACVTDKDKVIRLANTYACFFDEKACKCKTGDKKAIAECWKEFLNDPEVKKELAKEKKAPAPAAKKPLLKRK